ncbi:MCE-family protein Mce3D [Mycolicibacterium thermoresistibile]|uniref:Virulence factor Mce family protein n=1 Tax=Mycolicibacterium thermoresistibile TaxID=1797 RepID=A0A100XI14_MYCTH|nr:virulence factor Mce family protein [Mycolicibacterium thermoresistibile]SNW16593.1 MCE-family protein Mce3D [Mycolicibacterium thermoresistibile]
MRMVFSSCRNPRAVVAVALIVVLFAGIVGTVRLAQQGSRMTVVAYFENTTGVFPGDDVRILGVRVGQISAIEPQPDRVKVTFWVDERYPVPAEVNAVILSPQLVTGRAIQLTPAYTSGPMLADGAEIPLARTAVPVEWDDVREQLARVTQLLQPTAPGEPSTLGRAIDTAADNLRGQGPTIRDTIVRLSRAMSALGDHSQDVFGSLRNLSTLVSALHDSTGLLEQLNHNMAAVSALLAEDPDKVGRVVADLHALVGDLQQFVADNREPLEIASTRLDSVGTALVDSIDDIKQALHVAPTVLQNFSNIYEAANGSFTGALAANNFANPIQFLCGAVQAASRLGAEQAAKLCVQYLAPIVKNRQYNFPPLGLNLFVGAQARPNEVTYSEPWMRPDYVPPLPAEAAPAASPHGTTVAADPAAGLPGLLLPHGGDR